MSTIRRARKPRLSTGHGAESIEGGPPVAWTPARRNLDFLRPPQGQRVAPRISGFGRLDFLGIPWILSTETSLFNGLRATSRRFYSSCGSSPGKRPRPVRDGIGPLALRLMFA